MLQPGLYEQVISTEMDRALAAVPPDCQATAALDPAEASHVLAQYLDGVVKQGLDVLADGEGDGKLQEQIQLVNQIVELIQEKTGQAQIAELSVDQRAEQLLALMAEKDPRRVTGKKAADLVRPETSLAQSSLFTGARHEPQMYLELKKEICSSNSIDMLVSFVKWSGLRLILDELRDFTQGGGQLRIITTFYMGATDSKAVEELAALPNTEIRVSYDTKRTRLHAKTYIFYRDTGFSTAYVGSSNLSDAAMSSGLEWNLKVTAKDLPDTMQKIAATFDSYWNSAEFEPFQLEQRERLIDALQRERSSGGNGLGRTHFFDIRPYPYQSEILDKLQAEREVRGYWRNLVVAATGTGKTIVSAFDYLRFRKANPNQSRLLFVAHREEILKQSLETFQGVLRDPNFGDLFVGNFRPKDMRHVFVSIQTLNSQSLCQRLPADSYDFIVVDEFHHAAAPTYQALLTHFHPKVLLGLTATPERMDGKDILEYFDGRIAAEIRLPEAIDRKLLCPFQYFGVADTVDLNEVRWTRGGYEKSELTNLYTFTEQVAKRRAAHIVTSLERYVTDLQDVKALGFCVSIAHARFMAEQFNKAGIPSISLDGDSPDEERNSAAQRLVSGEIKVIFVVDIYNEGVDIPEVNTVLFLRPTESLTVFLQQMGRGLRLSPGKECLTVLDFVGQANRRYNFEEKYAALLDTHHHNVQRELESGFPSVPKGCFVQLERKAAAVILENIREYTNTKRGLLSRIRTFQEDAQLPLTLSNLLSFYHMDLRAIYQGKYSFSRLCVEAGVQDNFQESCETVLTKSFSRLVSIDSRRWIQFLVQTIPNLATLDPASLQPEEQRMLQMLYISIWQQAAKDWNAPEVRQNLRSLADSPIMRAELQDLLQCLLDRIDFVDEPVDLGFACPLDLHCTYTRDQILVAMDYLTPNQVREGVKWLPEKGIDILFVTLNKSDKDYSPTTMYMDYSINQELFHWQSQSTTTDTGSVGQRYIHHRQRGTRVLLFVREFKNEAGTAAPYTFLGTANYVTHQGSRPMSITWKLDRPIPAKYLKKTNKLVVG